MNRGQKILISEDDVLISEQLKYILLNLGYHVTDIVSDIDSAVTSLIENKPDLAILDIKMHGSNEGFVIAKYIHDELKIPFIFLTSFSDQKTVQEATGFSPKAYLLKPFNESNIYTTLETVFNNLQKSPDFIIIHDGIQRMKILVDDILWIKSDDKYVELFTLNKKYAIRESISGFLEKYKIHKIKRSHRSYAINTDYIDSVTGTHLIIKGEKIPISRTYFEEIHNSF